MSENNNNNNTIKILIAIIISLSMVIVFSGIFYILNMQSKIADLEQKQEEQLKQQLQTPNIPATETSQPQTNEEVEIKKPEQQSSSNKINSHKSKKNTTSIKKNQANINEREIERTIDDTINQIDRQNNNSNYSQNSKKEEDKLTRNIESVMGE
jgi:PASTA domain containing protein